MAGGESGAVGENYIERADGRVQKLAHIGQVDVQANDVMVICTPGGGGYGKM
jgi:5-oxoprolinase (ATP-hydrolysing)